MSGERTEEATPKKLRDARRRGEAWQSRELSGALVVLGAGLLGAGVASSSSSRIEGLFARAFEAARAPTPRGALAALTEALDVAAACAGPLLGGLVVVGVLASFAQVGPLFATDAAAPSLARLDPVAGARRLVGGRAWLELAKAAVKLGVVGAVALVTLREASPGVLGLALAPPARGLVVAGTLVEALLVRVGLAWLVLGVGDALLARWLFLRGQRMTREEVKREHREAEGDPHARRERERVRREIAQHDLLEAVRRADVVVVNPTHLAVALRFDEAGEQAAPELVGKGQDELAARIVAVAREAGVPVLQDVALARGLFALEVGEEVPERLWEAVAAVLRAAWAEREEAERGGR